MTDPDHRLKVCLRAASIACLLLAFSVAVSTSSLTVTAFNDTDRSAPSRGSN